METGTDSQLVSSSVPSGYGGSTLSAGVELFNSWQNRKQSEQNQNNQNKANRELAEYQYQNDIDMWNRMNEYNTPENQVKRMVEGGLNPALMYKGSPQNVATQLPKYNAPNMQYNQTALQAPNVLPILAQYQDVQLKKAQIDNVKQQTINSSMQSLGYWADSAMKSRTNEYMSQRYRDTKKSMGEALYQSQVDLNNERSRQLQLENQYSEVGIGRNDPYYMRLISRLIGDKGSNILNRASKNF